MKTITDKKLESLKNDNELNNDIINELLAMDKENRINYISDVLQYGCASGIATGLIYYVDTMRFFDTYRDEINQLLFAMFKDTGITFENFGDKFDYEDLTCSERFNQNLLAWFGYKETIRNIAYNLDLKV